MKIVLRVLLLAWIAAAAGPTSLAQRGGKATKDAEPPVVNVEPTKGVELEATLEVRARVADLSGIAQATIWARGKKDTEFRRFDMRPEAGEVWVALLPSWPQRGDQVAFYVHATDQAGNQTTAGSSGAPYMVQMVAPGAPGELSRSRPARWLGLGGLTVLVVLCGVYSVRAGRDRRKEAARREAEFWRRLVAPLIDIPEGPARDAALERLCGQRHHHPELGLVTIDRAEILGRLRDGRVNAEGGRRARPVAPAHDADRAGEPLQAVEEEIFWFRLLSPLQPMEARERDAALRELASRPHSHPTKGKQIFDLATLQREFERARRTKLETLQARWQRLRTEPADATGKSPADVARKGSAADAATPGTPSHRAEDEAGSPARTVMGRPGSGESAADIAEEIFWFTLLAPVRDLPPRMQQDALRDLSGRPQPHPVEGHRLFSYAALAHEFEWVRDANTGELQARWDAATLSMIEGVTAASSAMATTPGSDASAGLAPGDLSSDEPLDDRLEAVLGHGNPEAAPLDPRIT